MKRLPIEARRRITATLSPVASQTSRRPTIPVTAEGWESILEDAGLSAGSPFSAALEAVDEMVLSEDPAAIREATHHLADLVERMMSDLDLVRAFQPSGDGRTSSARKAILAIAEGALAAVVHRETAGVSGRHQRFRALVASLRVEPPVVTDPLQSVFGASRNELANSDGNVTVERVVAALHSQTDRRIDPAAQILSPLTSNPPQGYVGIRAALSLVTAPRPLLTLRTALQVQELVLRRATADPAATAAVINRHGSYVERSAASHRGMTRLRADISTANLPSEVAYLSLDFYRRLVESQVRPWIWVLLRLSGRTARSSPAELGTAVQQLRASSLPILEAWVAPILLASRNAAAHEDFEWDHAAGMLRVGSSLVTTPELWRAIEEGYSLMIGAECALSCARADNPRLAKSLDADGPARHSRTLSLNAALSRFGTNGLWVRRASWDGSLAMVELDALDLHQLHPCFQALIETVEWVTAELFEIRIGDQAEPIIQLRATTVHACREMWKCALRSSYRIPPSVFLPMNVETRLRIEDSRTAAEAAAWLALDSALIAFEEHQPQFDEGKNRLATHLAIARTATRVTLQHFPALDTDAFRTAGGLIEAAELAAQAYASGIPFLNLDSFVSKLGAALDSLERPQILPTLVTPPPEGP